MVGEVGTVVGTIMVVVVKNITRGPNFSTHRRTVSYEMSSPRDRRHRVEPDPAVLAARYGLIRRFPTGTLARN
jgi:hypothetical protein